MSPFFSIIVPIYNAEKYLGQCLSSILEQEFTDYELLLINDGSTDCSAGICKTYAKKASCIKIYNQKNSGVSVARNVGINNSTGKWLLFIDADDMLTANALATLHELLFSNTLDLVIGGYEAIQGTEKNSTSDLNFTVIKTKDEGVTQMYQNIFWPWFICSKTFNSSIIKSKKILFDNNICFGEDRLFIMKYLCHIKSKILFTSTPFYIYRTHENSVQNKVNTTFSEKMLTGFDSAILMYKEISKTNTSTLNKELATYDLINSYRDMIRLMHRTNAPKRYFIEVEKRFFRIIPIYKFWYFIIKRRGKSM